MIAAIRRALRRMTPLEMASREKAMAELELLTALTAQDYAASVASYNTARINRLRAFIQEQNKEV